MIWRDPWRRFLASLVVFWDFMVAALAILVALVLVVSPWLLLSIGGWPLFLRWYLLPYPFGLAAFTAIMAFVYRRELLARARNWRADRKSQELKKAA